MFSMRLIGGQQSKPGQATTAIAEPKEYDEQLDNIISLLHDACELLEAQGTLTFWVEGFGQHPWPATVSIDLCVCLEQIPELVAWMKHETAGVFELAFYEQTLMRYLYLENSRDRITIRCKSLWPRWQPAPEFETVERCDLRAMVRDLVKTFVSEAARSAPHIVAHPWFVEWRSAAEGLG